MNVKSTTVMLICLLLSSLTVPVMGWGGGGCSGNPPTPCHKCEGSVWVNQCNSSECEDCNDTTGECYFTYDPECEYCEEGEPECIPINIISLTSDKDLACVGCEIEFEVTLDPELYDCVDWEADGDADPYYQKGGQTFKTKWESPTSQSNDTYVTVYTCYDHEEEGDEEWKEVTIVAVDEVVKAGTIDAGPLYVCLNGIVNLEAKPCPGGVSFPPGRPNWEIESQPSGASASLNPSSGSAARTLDNLTEPGDYVVKAKCGSSDSGDPITVTVFKIKPETVSGTPANRHRTLLGIGEEVICWTEPSVSVDWRLNSLGGGTVNPTFGTSTTFIAGKSPSSPILHAKKGTADCTLYFTVIAPNGMNSVLKQDLTPGVPGPPNNIIGSSSEFTCTVLPTTVCFYWAEFRENIPLNEWTWPDTTDASYGPKTVTWGVGYDNKTTDTCTCYGYPIGRIHDGSNYVDFTVTWCVPEEYKNQANNWILWLPYEQHHTEYQGSDQKSCQILQATNIASGGWMGPWQ